MSTASFLTQDESPGQHQFDANTLSLAPQSMQVRLHTVFGAYSQSDLAIAILLSEVTQGLKLQYIEFILCMSMIEEDKQN